MFLPQMPFLLLIYIGFKVGPRISTHLPWIPKNPSPSNHLIGELFKWLVSKWKDAQDWRDQDNTNENHNDIPFCT